MTENIVMMFAMIIMMIKMVILIIIIMFISHRVMDGYNDDKETVDR